MLIITRNVSESFFISKNIQVKIISISGKQARIGIEAPKNVLVLREEIRERKKSKV